MRLEKDAIMKNSCYILILSGLLLLAGSCSQEDLMPTGNDAQQGEPTGNGQITLSFRLAENAGTATRANDGMEEEEGNIETLDYAIFQGKRRVKYKRILGDELTVHSTGDDGVKNIYTLRNVEEEWFDETTEIFAVVNAPEKMHDALFTSEPTSVAADNATLLSILDDYIKEKARIDTYDDLIKAQYSGTECPKEGSLYYKPINKNNLTKAQYTLTADQTFSDYADLISKKQSASGDALVMYNKFIEDIECRFELFRTSDYNKHLTERQAQKETLAQELSQDTDFRRYILWRDYVHTEDLNQTAAKSKNRQLDNPLMSGYLALGNNIGSIITVPVEHAYCRICFQCSFTGVIDDVFNKEHKYIDFESIEVEKLPNKTKLFNISSVNSENNPSDGTLDWTAKIAIAADADGASDKQAPFFGDLAQNPSHWGNDWESNFRYYPEYATYSTVCRYPLKPNSNEFDTSNAKRYYIYAYQWGGTSTDADPKITLSYGFTEPEKSEITHKELWAYLYDDTHSDAKLHHGLLRNYTYIVNCHLNANTSKLELQVTSHDWYTHTVTDIPAFE